MPQGVRSQQGLREGASCKHPVETEMRRVIGSKYIAKSNTHRVRIAWSVLQLRGPGNCWSERKKGGKYTLQKYMGEVSF